MQRKLVPLGLVWLVFFLSLAPYAYAAPLVDTIKYWPVQEMAVVELVGTNEQVDASEYSASVSLTLSGSGSIQKVCIVTTEFDTGTILTPAINLFFMDADPASVAGDTTISRAERRTIFSQIVLAKADYQVDTIGGINCQAVDEEYHNMGGTMYVLFFLNAAEMSINDVAGDDEVIELRVFYRRDQ